MTAREVGEVIRDEWRVVDARGETESITTHARVAWEVAACLHGSTVWHRQVRTITTPWRQLAQDEILNRNGEVATDD